MRFLATVALSFLIYLPLTQAQTITSQEDYEKLLPYWGVTWTPGAAAVNGYYPSFYTGFAPRSQAPERIHVRLARGNQTRVTVILDEQTVSDYLFDLAKRNEFYKKAVATKLINVNPDKSRLLPQMTYFQQVVESARYSIPKTVADAKRGTLSIETLYLKSLELLTELNPGRVFHVKLDLVTEFSKWKTQVQQTVRNPATELGDKQKALIAINSLVWGRVNLTREPSAELLQKLAHTAELALADSPEFVTAAADLFLTATGTKYRIRTVDDRGQWREAVDCTGTADCTLAYPEFTAIYPTGSTMSSTADKFGNLINTFATPGLWQFLSRGTRHDVDNIREEPYYGWAPKMDYQAIGNGFHNPAVRFAGVSADVKKLLGINESHSTLWAVKRGAVSSGCSRLPLGHVWEMRHIFPVENEKMTQIQFFGNHPQDFDVFDIDGDGQAEVMGVEYMISYNLKGTSGLAKREGVDLEISGTKKLEFYQTLYGARGVFTVDARGTYFFEDPGVSLPSYLDFQKTQVKTRLTMRGQYPLYEQPYERDKVQFYSTDGMSELTKVGKAPRAKRIVRLFGRVKGCAPTADKKQCGEAAFDQEVSELLTGR